MEDFRIFFKGVLTYVKYVYKLNKTFLKALSVCPNC